MTALKRIGAFLVAGLVTTLLGTVLQTQLNLARLHDIGGAVSFDLRLNVTAQDLAGFAPTLGVLVAVGFLIAFLVTGLVRRRVQRGRPALYALAGAVAMTALLLLMEAALGLTVIAAARDLGGFVGLMLCGAAGGWVFATFSAKRADVG